MMARPGQVIALSLEPGTAAWAAGWTESVGVAAILQRQGSRSLCIGYGWHILFTPGLRCQPGDHISRSLEVTSADQAPAGSVQVRMGSAAAYAVDVPLTDIQMSDMGRAGVGLTQDWSDPVGPWVWSSGPAPVLTIANPRVPRRGLVTLKGVVFSDGKHPQTISLLDGEGRVLTSASATGGDITLAAPVTASAPGMVEVRLKVAHPVSPKSIGQSADPRLLGFGLKSLSLVPAS
jgi:hypothetical protein